MKMTLREAMKSYMDHVPPSRSPATVEDCRNWIGAISKWYSANGYMDKPVSAGLNRRVVTEMLDSMAPRCSYTTLKLYGRMIKWIGTHMVYLEVIKENPLRGFNPLLHIRNKPKLSRPRSSCTEDTYRLLIKAAEAPDVLPEWKHVIRLGWETGMRIGDIVHLGPEHVLWDQRLIRVLPRKTFRNREVAAEVPITRSTLKMLKDLRTGGKYFFPILQATYENSSGFRSLFYTITRKAGLNNVCFHMLRHGFVTTLRSKGVDVAIIASMTGQSIQTVLSYGSASTDAKRKALGIT